MYLFQTCEKRKRGLTLRWNSRVSDFRGSRAFTKGSWGITSKHKGPPSTESYPQGAVRVSFGGPLRKWKPSKKIGVEERQRKKCKIKICVRICRKVIDISRFFRFTWKSTAWNLERVGSIFQLGFHDARLDKKSKAPFGFTILFYQRTHTVFYTPSSSFSLFSFLLDARSFSASLFLFHLFFFLFLCLDFYWFPSLSLSLIPSRAGFHTHVFVCS